MLEICKKKCVDGQEINCRTDEALLARCLDNEDEWVSRSTKDEFCEYKFSMWRLCSKLQEYNPWVSCDDLAMDANTCADDFYRH